MRTPSGRHRQLLSALIASAIGSSLCGCGRDAGDSGRPGPSSAGPSTDDGGASSSTDASSSESSAGPPTGDGGASSLADASFGADASPGDDGSCAILDNWCSGVQTDSSDSGDSLQLDASDWAGSFCALTGTSGSYPVEPSRCEPQVARSSTCYICGLTLHSFWTIDVPCRPDAVDANADGDAGALDGILCAPAACDQRCLALCLAANPFAGTMYDPGNVTKCVIQSIGPSIRVECAFDPTVCSGRLPRGFRPRRVAARSRSGERLAQIAQLEAASVDAFHALHSDLARLGAPRGLLRAVRGARKDEVRHARDVAREAGRLGARVPETRVAPIATRTLEELAIDNAEEGCVRETFGAAVAAIQAARARDGRVRRMMGRIARDELGHAALSWRIAEWLHARLDAASRARVRDARSAAVAMLEGELATDQPGDDLLGLPGARAARAVLDGMREAILAGDLTPNPSGPRVER